MTLSPEFRHADRIAKARRVRTPRGAQHYGQPIGTIITRDLPISADMKEKEERRERINQAKSIAAHVSDYADSTAGALSNWQMKQAQEAYRWLFDYRRRHRNVIDFEVEDAMAQLRAMVDRQVLAKAKGPVDGDGDGWVYDGTPRKRPATPAEMEAGRKMRQAAKKVGGPVAAKKAAKKAPAKNDYDKRFDKFDRAINQAIRAKDPKEVKRVRDLIRQDLVMKPNDRKDLEAILDARRDGKPDPAPVAGGNRAKRGVQGGGAPVAPKPAAKKAAAKKVAAPKAEVKPERNANNDALKAGRKAEMADQARENARKRAAAKKKTGPVTRAHRKFREAGLKVPTESRMPKTQQSQMDRDAQAAAARKPVRAAAKKKAVEKPVTTPHGPKTNAWMQLAARDIQRAPSFRKLKGLITQISNKQASGQISQRQANDMRQMVYNRLDELGLDRNGHPKAPAPKKERMTDRIKRHALRFRQIDTGNRDALRQEMDSFNRSNARERIRTDEGLNAAIRSGAMRARNIKPAKKKTTDFGNLPDTPPRQKAQEAAMKMNARIDAAQDLDALDKVQQVLRGPAFREERKAIRNNPSVMARINERFKAKREELKNKPEPQTIKPKLPPGAARQRAGENLPSDWSQRFDRIDNIEDPNQRLSELDQAMDALEADKVMEKEEFNRVAEALNDRMEQVDEDLNAMARIKGQFAQRIPAEQRAALDKHFSKKSGTIANAPKEGLFQYIVGNTERFDVKRQETNKGVSGIDIITDKQTGERWFAKHTEFDNDYGKEKMAADILNAAGLSKHRGVVAKGGPYVRYQKPGMFQGGGMQEYPGAVLLSQDAIQGNGGKGKLIRAADMNHSQIAKAIEEVLKGLREGDPQGLIDLMIFDYLIDNTVDRHAKNAFFEQDGGRLKMQFIDQGLAFGGFAGNPDLNIGIVEWLSRWRGAGWGFMSLVGETTKSRDDVARRIRASIERLRGLDLDSIYAQYRRDLGDNEEAMGQLQMMADVLETRLANLTQVDIVDDLVRALAKGGGF